MKKILISFALIVSVANAGWLGKLGSTVSSVFSSVTLVENPKGAYLQTCFNPKTTRDATGKYTLKCNSCKANGVFVKQSFNPSIIYTNPKATFHSDANGKLVQDWSLSGIFN